MSTRATYQINGTTLYIHHDGYPEGAAQYFRAALDWAEQYRAKHQRNRGLAEAFITANDRSELCKGHHVFGDTEWRYTVTGQDLKAEKRNMASDTWHPHFDGPLLDFVAKYPAEAAQ